MKFKYRQNMTVIVTTVSMQDQYLKLFWIVKIIDDILLELADYEVASAKQLDIF